MTTIIDDFADLMVHTILIAPRTGQDNYGKPSYGSDVSLDGRIMRKVKRVVTDAGEERMSDRTIVLALARSVSILDRITLPSGFDPLTPPIVAVRKFVAEDNSLHSIIFI